MRMEIKRFFLVFSENVQFLSWNLVNFRKYCPFYASIDHLVQIIQKHPNPLSAFSLSGNCPTRPTTSPSWCPSQLVSNPPSVYNCYAILISDTNLLYFLHPSDPSGNTEWPSYSDKGEYQMGRPSRANEKALELL